MPEPRTRTYDIADPADRARFLADFAGPGSRGFLLARSPSLPAMTIRVAGAMLYAAPAAHAALMAYADGGPADE